MAHRITAVAPDGIAYALGIRPGDELVAINGRAVLDLIDYQAFTCERRLRLTVAREGQAREYACVKDEYAPLGLQFDSPLMSRQRDCVNRCVFCFVDQLPEHVRDTLRVKDDDWRMSLMMGNFVTLTNVSDRELDRIIERRCAPLYISVHATDPDVREALLQTPRARNILPQLTRLRDARLTFHAQAVVCPGINDGAVLERTVNDLMALYPAAQSLAIVPVGLTRHRAHCAQLRAFQASDALAILERAEVWRADCLKRFGTRFVFPADELYLMAGRPFPDDEAYEDYAQIENGIGLCRQLATQVADARAELYEAQAQDGAKRNVAIACGVSVAPFLEKLIATHAVDNAHVTVYPIVNDFFGDSVTVSGLLTGGALIRQLSGLDADVLLISASMLREGADVFLDDTTIYEVSDALGMPIVPIADGDALVRALLGIERERE